MNEIYFPFHSVFEEKFFSSVAKTLKSSITNDLITVPDSEGHGSVLLKKIDEGLMFLSCNIRLDRIMVIEKMPKTELNKKDFFLVTYILKANNIRFEGKGIPKDFEIKPGQNTFLVDDNASLKTSIPAGEIFRTINIGIDIRWLRKELNNSDLAVSKFIQMLEQNQIPDFIMSASKPSEIKILFELNRNSIEYNSNLLFFKARILSLVSDFFSTLFSSFYKENIIASDTAQNRISEVELLLKDHLERKFPGMESIAKQMSMSVSTVKRHFLAMYGCGIHEYFLALKMVHAKQLLLEESLSVNEVAEKLAYEKVSSFIETFKNHYGTSPGMFKKSIDKKPFVIEN